MSDERNSCIGGPGTKGVVRTWSEDPLTARARSVWTSGLGTGDRGHKEPGRLGAWTVGDEVAKAA